MDGTQNLIKKSLTVKELLGRYLNDIEEKNSPKILYTSGSMSIPIPGPRVAIIGTRQPSETGLKLAKDLAYFFAKKGVNIISGLAKGIDAEAHRGAIEAGGNTVSVLGTPLNRFYPRENYDLQMEIMKNHLAVTQFPEGKPIQRQDFVARNRTMALICDASIIVEAGETSGTLSQGWESLRLGRPLFICESVFENANLEWPKTFENYGALRLSEPEDVFEELPSSDFRTLTPLLWRI